MVVMHVKPKTSSSKLLFHENILESVIENMKRFHSCNACKP